MKSIRNLLLTLVSLAVSTGSWAADTYKLDGSHTTVGFTIAHLVISEVSGRFNEVAGEITIDKDTLATAKATIQTKSIDTQNEKRDEHLRKPDFFDAEKYPTITFESLKVAKDGDKTTVTGKFTMHGTTKEIQLPVTLKGPIKDPWGNSRVALVAETTINRTDYGMKTMMGVGDEVKIRITTEAVKAEDKK
ncbi:MAG: YceI family protein [Verrucomicrobiota bacterium]